MITIKRIDSQKINDDDFNVSNLHEASLPPKDYKEVNSFGNTKNWIKSFHSDFQVINVKGFDLKWMKEAYNIGKFTRKFSDIYKYELEDFCERKCNKSIIFPKEGYFVRTEYVSLKKGIHGIGPYFDIKSIIESICTSTQQHATIEESDLELNIYLMKWLEMDSKKEFRVFVNNNKITGISVQNIYVENSYISSLSDDKLEIFVENVSKYFENDFTNIWKTTITSQKTNNYTFDMVILEKDMCNAKSFYFIESNPFGRNYAAGSALFHWIHDDVLYNDKGIIEFRCVI